MKPGFFLLLVFLLVQTVPGRAQSDGKTDFEMHCSGCHPQGGNSLNPAKTLSKIVREANGVRTAADIVRIMRKPEEGMRVFTKDDIPDNRAKAIAEYILATF